MTAPTICRTTIVAVLLATVAALLARSWLQIRLVARGFESQLAADVSYLIVPLVMLLLLFPLWRTERDYLRSRFSVCGLSLKCILTAVLVGILLRLLWWCQLTVGISFGVFSSPSSEAVVGPVFSFQCPSLDIVAMNLFILAVLTPVIEEVTHRGYLLSALQNRGTLVAVAVSAMSFAALHQTVSMPFAFFAGIIFGIQYVKSTTLWPSIISHATVNALTILDWRCLSGHWNPHGDNIPLWIPGTAALLVALSCATALFGLLRTPPNAKTSYRGADTPR